MSRRKPCRLFAHFNQAPFFSLRFKDVSSELFFSKYRYSIDGSSSRALSIACGSSSWSFQYGWSRTSRRLLANLLHRLLLSHFSRLLARPQCFATSVVRLRCALDVFPASGDADGRTSSPTMWRTFRDLHHFSLSFLKDGALPRLSSLF